MKNLTEFEFLEWATRNGMGLDENYPRSRSLVFRTAPNQSRFWCVPSEPECRPYLLSSLVELMGDWERCYVWKHLGSWSDSADPGEIDEVVNLRLLKGLALPSGTAEVVEFPRVEMDPLVALILLTTIFGWTVA